MQVGSVDLTRVLELEVPVPRETLAIGRSPADLISSAKWATPEYVTDEGLVRFALAATCLISDDRKVVIDPCISFDQRKAADGEAQASRFFAAMAASGFPAEEVDIVAHTHIDGVGWDTRPEGEGWVPGFPNARHLFTRTEVERVLKADTDETRALQVLLDARVVEQVDAPLDVSSHVRLEPAPGHTPGNVNVWIESEGESAVVVGDLLLHPLQCADPEWAGLDFDAERAVAARRRVLAEATERGSLVIGPHFASPGAFHVVADGAGWRPRGT